MVVSLGIGWKASTASRTFRIGDSGCRSSTGTSQPPRVLRARALRTKRAWATRVAPSGGLTPWGIGKRLHCWNVSRRKTALCSSVRASSTAFCTRSRRVCASAPSPCVRSRWTAGASGNEAPNLIPASSRIVTSCSGRSAIGASGRARSGRPSTSEGRHTTSLGFARVQH